MQPPQIPEAVTRLTSLEELDVSNNDLGNLPPVLGTMTLLRSLAVEGNRFARGAFPSLKYAPCTRANPPSSELARRDAVSPKRPEMHQ